MEHKETASSHLLLKGRMAYSAMKKMIEVIMSSFLKGP